MSEQDPTPISPMIDGDELELLDLRDVVDYSVYEARLVSGSLGTRELKGVDFKGCRLEATRLTGAHLVRVRMVDTIVSDTECSGANP